ncbi:MAG: hypothetical protein AAF371_00110 [Pseudomonadota bacterium]
MAEATPGTVAVLTGDIVGSTALPAGDLERVFTRLSSAHGIAAAWPLRIGPLGRFRGDGWQILVGEPGRALRLALFLRASLMAEDARFDTRVSVGIGPGAFSTADPSELDAAAFRLSGRGLDSMRRSERLAMVTEQAPRLLGPAIALCDAIAQRWTPAQCTVLGHALAPSPPLQKEIAAALGHRPQSVSEHLAGAAFGPVSALLSEVEQFWRVAAQQPETGLIA